MEIVYFSYVSVQMAGCFNLHVMVNKGYLAIPSKYEKLITSLRSAYAEELTLDKDNTSYSDRLDALRLSLKGYNTK